MQPQVICWGKVKTHTNKRHDGKRGKRRQTRKESASYVSRLFLILKVFAVLIITTFGEPGLDIQWWCKCESPISYQRCICHDHSISDFDHHHLHICTLMFEQRRAGEVMLWDKESIKLKFVSAATPRHSSTIAASQTCARELQNHLQIQLGPFVFKSRS